MDTKTFREFASNRILQAIIEINDDVYPSFPIKMPAFCYLTFDESGIAIHGVAPLLNKKKKEVITTLAYEQIQHIEINPVKKVIGAVFGLGFRINLDLKLLLKDDTQLHVACESLSVVVALSELLSRHHTPMVDAFNLVDLFKEAKTTQEAYDYLSDHLDELAAEKQVEVLQLKQTEDVSSNG